MIQLIPLPVPTEITLLIPPTRPPFSSPLSFILKAGPIVSLPFVISLTMISSRLIAKHASKASRHLSTTAVIAQEPINRYSRVITQPKAQGASQVRSASEAN
jgi:hypothetical protein